VKTGPLVLVVDPDDDSRIILATCIRHGGYEVAEAASAAAGLEAARRLLPRMIVGEHPIPMADGAALCDVLKRDPTTAVIPFLAVTSRITEQERRSAESGHYRVIAKPLRLPSVLEAISEVLEATIHETGPHPRGPADRGQRGRVEHDTDPTAGSV
jgi:CheY-like chemotaxis protein